jgi:hypothetical protein
VLLALILEGVGAGAEAFTVTVAAEGAVGDLAYDPHPHGSAAKSCSGVHMSNRIAPCLPMASSCVQEYVPMYSTAITEIFVGAFPLRQMGQTGKSPFGPLYTGAGVGEAWTLGAVEDVQQA